MILLAGIYYPEGYKGSKLYWKWKSRRVGRPTIYWELIKLIHKLQPVSHSAPIADSLPPSAGHPSSWPSRAGMGTGRSAA